ncbi:MAG: alginate export family protein [Bryobacteraceae bacterium]
MAICASLRAALFFCSLGACLPVLAQTSSPAGDTAPSWLTPTVDLNSGLPAWLHFDGQYRNRVERSDHIRFGTAGDTYDLGQFRLQMTIRPLAWLSFVAETQDSTAFWNQRIPSAPPYQNTWDLHQAYVEIGDAQKSHISALVGRQVLAFGEERMIGPSDWLNQGRVFDVARLDLTYNRLRATVFASSVVLAREGVLDHHLQGNNLDGVYLTLSGMPFHSTLEPYGLWNIQPSNAHLANAGLGPMSEATLGALWRGKLPGALEFGVEMDLQAGSLGTYSIHSWGGHWLVARRWSGIPLRPRLFIEGNYATGTKDFTRGTYSTFDEVYPSSHNKLGFADQIGWRNIEHLRMGIEQTLGSKWKLNETFEEFWLAEARDSLYASSGAPLFRSPTGAAGRHVGSEFDFWADYTLNTAITIGFGYSHLFTGEFLNHVTPGKDFNYPFVYLTYRFANKPVR